MFLKSCSIALACLLGLLALAMPRPASAQVYPCPAGAGPGERFVGVSPGGRGVAPVPLCERMSDGAAYPQAAAPSDHAAIAFHPDVGDVWATARMAHAGSARDALDACTEAMAEGCQMVPYSDGAMVVSVTRSGELAWASESSVRKARKSLRAYCERMNLYCTEIAALRSDDTYPKFSVEEVVNLREPANLARKRYGAVSWPESEDDDRAWISTGHDSEADAKQAANAACRQALAGNGICEVTTTSGNGVFAAIVSENKHRVFTAARSEQQALEIMNAICKKRALGTCNVDKIYQVKQPGTFLHDFKD